MSELLWDDVEGIFRVTRSALVMYVVAIVLIRVAGKRATSQMNNFDWIVTVALGSIVGSTIVLKDVPIAEGLAAIIVLLIAQYFLTKASSMWRSFAKVVYSEPAIVFFRGEFVDSAMLKERVTKQEVLAAIREAGMYRLEEVGAVVLETDANLSVLPASEATFDGKPITLRDVENYDQVLDTAGRRT